MNLGKSKKNAHIQAFFLFWKRNHILIEFLPMGANARLLVQIDTHGCKSKVAVEKYPILRKDSAVDTILRLLYEKTAGVHSCRNK
ncbi:MAG: hypothetical protein PUE41_08635 [bacterium]|nr:hypothetical protein [bacterium]